MSTVDAGWYPDPDQPTQVRYWDGAQWTEHVQVAQPVQAHVAAGWYPDPQRPGVQRYWDGSQWTDQVQIVPIFDGEMVVGALSSKKKARLVVMPEEMWWGDAHVRWDEVTNFAQLITVQNGYETMFEVDLQHGASVTKVLYFRHQKRDHTPRQAYEAIIERLRLSIGARTIAEALRLIAAGESLRFAGLLFSPEGFCHEAKGQAPIPWREYAGVNVSGRQALSVELLRSTDGDKAKSACRVNVDLLRAWLIPEVAQACADRYRAA